MLPMRRAKLKVLWPVVLFITVAVMNFFAPAQRPADRLLDDDDVLPNVTVTIGTVMFWSEYEPIAVLHDEWTTSSGSAALLRTVPRAIVPAGSNRDGGAAMSALRGRLFSLARHRTEVPVPCPQLARRSVELAAASCATYIRSLLADRIPITRHRQRGPRFIADRVQFANGVVTRFVAEDSRPPKARRRQCHGVPAGSAGSIHES